MKVRNSLQVLEGQAGLDRRPAPRSDVRRQQAAPALEGPPGMTAPKVTVPGEYVPSPAPWVRDQVEAYERTGGREANTLGDTGLPVVIVTMRGNKSGSVRKIALMRVEHDGEYALVASKGGAPAASRSGTTTCGRIPTRSSSRTGPSPSRPRSAR